MFFTSPEDAFVNGAVRSRGACLGSRHVINYGDWQTGLPEGGIKVGGVPFVAREHPSPPPGAVFLDPSVVFGDGSHPTTLSCLRQMAKIVRTQRVSSFLDLGTGTGILALAAARMGIRRVLAIDGNRLAVRTARKNVEINSLSSTVEVREGEARLFIDEPFDIVAANLPFQTLRELSTLRGVKLHRFWILSGINEDQGEVLRQLFSEQGYGIIHQHDDPPWVTFTIAGKRGPSQIRRNPT